MENAEKGVRGGNDEGYLIVTKTKRPSGKAWLGSQSQKNERSKRISKAMDADTTYSK